MRTPPQRRRRFRDRAGHGCRGAHGAPGTDSNREVSKSATKGLRGGNELEEKTGIPMIVFSQSVRIRTFVADLDIGSRTSSPREDVTALRTGSRPLVEENLAPGYESGPSRARAAGGVVDLDSTCRSRDPGIRTGGVSGSAHERERIRAEPPGRARVPGRPRLPRRRLPRRRLCSPGRSLAPRLRRRAARRHPRRPRRSPPRPGRSLLRRLQGDRRPLRGPRRLGAAHRPGPA